MHTLSSAKRTCIASASAVEWMATVAMPSSRQARCTRSAISPRLAIRIFWNNGLFQNHQHLAVFHRPAGDDENLRHDAGFRRLDLVERLHRLDQQQGLPRLDGLADRDIGRRAR